MAEDKMYLIITLRKEVADKAAAKAIHELVKERFADRPDVKISAQATNHFELDT